jgi:hypothetical protein
MDIIVIIRSSQPLSPTDTAADPQKLRAAMLMT